jgi:uncharacterized protein (TIGR00369 family)
VTDFSQVTPAEIRSFISGYFPGNLAIDPVEIGRERAIARVEVDKRHLHPGQYVHGGVWAALGDTAAAWLTFAVIPPGADFTTIELKLNVFGSGRDGDVLTAVATPLHSGRSTVVAEVRIEREREGSEPKLAANLIVTQFVIVRD